MRLGRVVAHCVAGRKDRQGTGRTDDQRATCDPPSRSRRVLDRTARGRAWRSTSSTIRSPHQFGTDLKDVSPSSPRRDPRRRRHRRQRPDRTDGCAVGRSSRRQAGDDHARRRRGRPHGPARAARARRLLRARGAQRPRRGHDHDACAKTPFSSAVARRALARFGFVDQASARSTSPSEIIRTLRRAHHRPESRRRARCPAAICKNSWSDAK